MNTVWYAIDSTLSAWITVVSSINRSCLRLDVVGLLLNKIVKSTRAQSIKGALSIYGFKSHAPLESVYQLVRHSTVS